MGGVAVNGQRGVVTSGTGPHGSGESRSRVGESGLGLTRLRRGVWWLGRVFDVGRYGVNGGAGVEEGADRSGLGIVIGMVVVRPEGEGVVGAVEVHNSAACVAVVRCSRSFFEWVWGVERAGVFGEGSCCGGQRRGGGGGERVKVGRRRRVLKALVW